MPEALSVKVKFENGEEWELDLRTTDRKVVIVDGLIVGCSHGIGFAIYKDGQIVCSFCKEPLKKFPHWKGHLVRLTSEVRDRKKS